MTPTQYVNWAEITGQWDRIGPNRAAEFDWRTQLATGDRDPLPAHMTWLHPAAGSPA